MNRFATATLVVSLANLAHADPAQSTSSAAPSKLTTPPTGAASPSKPPPPPDEIADVESREANLEPHEPRSGFTFSLAPSFGIMLGGDVGVGRGGAASFRLGHVATRRTVITFELAGTTALHKQTGIGPDPKEGPTLQDSNFGLFVGAQTYRSKALWLRGAGGITFSVKDAMVDGTGGNKGPTGVGGLVGAGVDFARWGYFVLAVESSALASASSDGLKLQLLLPFVSLSYY